MESVPPNPDRPRTAESCSPWRLVFQVEVASPSVAPLVADVTNEDSAHRAVALAQQRFGGLDILVNNAGISSTKPSPI